MKQSLLVAAAAAAIGAAAAVLFTERPVVPARTPGPARALDTVALEAAFRRALESVGFARQARAVAPAVDTEAAPRDRASPVPAARAATADGAAPLPPADPAALHGVRAFDRDDDQRRAWLFRSERDVMEWLGTPNLVSAGGGVERWIYNLADGSDVTLEFHRGRLLNLYR